MKFSLRLASATTAALLALLALTGVSLPAQAAADPSLATGGNAPGGWPLDQSAYEAFFGSLGLNAPQGTVVADSGFRPFPHGFPIPNWGPPEGFVNNQLVYGLPKRLTLEQYGAGEYEVPATLNSLALRRTLGDGVCRDPKKIDPKTGSCDLLLGAELLVQMIETSAQGGHCLGIAAAAAALYNGQLPANQVGASGLGINAYNPMGNPAIQTIKRLFGTQLLNASLMSVAIAGQSPKEVVQTLIDTLPTGQVPFVLGIYRPGGHAITPYAVLDRGNGLFDIAVYDNNFPMRALAVTVDTNADTFNYTSATDPNSPIFTWSTEAGSTFGLVPVDDVLAVQPCPICRGRNSGTLLAFSTLETKNDGAITIGLTDAAGKPLAENLYQVMHPLNPPTDGQITLPLFSVNPGVNFFVNITVGNLAISQALEVYAISNDASEVLALEKLVSNSVTVFGGGSRSAIFSSTSGSSPRIQQLADGRSNSYSVNGHPLVLPKEVLVQQVWNRGNKTVRYRTSAEESLRWNVQVTQDPNQSDADWVGLRVAVPADSEILVNYSQMSESVPPLAWVVNEDKTRTPVTMVKVTPALIKANADDVYLQIGPRSR